MNEKVPWFLKFFVIVFSQCDVISQIPLLVQLKSRLTSEHTDGEMGIMDDLCPRLCWVEHRKAMALTNYYFSFAWLMAI